MKEYSLGRIFGLSISVTPSAQVGSLVVWAAVTLFAIIALDAPLGWAILGGLLAVPLHWLGELLHQFGHARAARRVGYPMTGVRLIGVLGASLYPPDEGELPAAVHIQRALGGPSFSAVVSVVAFVISLILALTGDFLRWLGLFFFLENFLIFTLGAFVPLPFFETDGETLLRWWKRH